ncbi:MAG: DUF4923 family protein [Muribaculaceae bacterium]|nr:DUF4923 family protein [Muribaculaceae bacterium]
MRRLILLSMLVLLCTAAVGCRTASDVAVEHSVVATRSITGTWHYDGASVEAQGVNVLSKVAKPIAKSKLKKKLDKAFKKLKMSKSNSWLELNADGTFAMRLVGPEVKGKYTYDADEGRLTLRWHGLPMTVNVRRDSKHLHLLVDTDRLLQLLQLVSGLGHNKTLQSIATLAENYNDVQVGFAFK